MYRLTSISAIAIWLWASAVLHGVSAVDTATVSITNELAFSVQPACVQSCLFYNSFSVANYLLESLGCTSTIYNQCYCTQIQDQIASTALSTCVNALCRATTEISNAISLYESYCGGAGYPRSAPAIQTTAMTTSSPALQSASATPPSTTSAPTPANTSPSSSNTTPSSTSSLSTSSSSSQQSNSSSTTSTSKGKSKTGPIVGGVIGGLAALALIIAIIFMYLRSQRKKSAQGQHQQPAAIPPPAPQPEKQTERPVSPVSAMDAPADVAKKPAGGRAELDTKENERLVNVAEADYTPVTEIQGDGRHGLRPEELDANGRYIGELHGDGRHLTSSELP